MSGSLQSLEPDVAPARRRSANDPVCPSFACGLSSVGRCITEVGQPGLRRPDCSMSSLAVSKSPRDAACERRPIPPRFPPFRLGAVLVDSPDGRALHGRRSGRPRRSFPDERPSVLLGITSPRPLGVGGIRREGGVGRPIPMARRGAGPAQPAPLKLLSRSRVLVCTDRGDPSRRTARRSRRSSRCCLGHRGIHRSDD